MQNDIGTLWLIVATVLVLSMQAGFLMLEGGRVRAKNSINVAQKNVTDLVLAWVAFISLGSWIMFGLSASNIMDADTIMANATHTLSPLHLIYQLAFCSTAATIVSGAVAERFSFRAYMVLTIVVAGLIYPLVGRLVWGDIYNTGARAWLAELGFIDFAGSTVVHSLGAWVGFVAILMIGPRTGRFDEHGNPRNMPAYNAVIALFGVFILLFGWLGFNGGSVPPSDPLLSAVLFATLTAGAFGGCLGMGIGAWLDNGAFNPSRVTSGILGGLVACTASVHLLDMYEAMLVGAAGGAIATYGAHILLHRFKVDDPLDAVATHGFAGVFGTLAVAFVMPVSAIQSSSRLIQFAVQGVGVLVVAIITGVATYLTLTVLKRFMEVRVSADAEHIGLNYTEHGESIGIARLQSALNGTLQDNASFASGVAANAINADDEHSELANTLNQVIGKYESASEQIRIAQNRFKQFAETASDWLWEADANLDITFIHANAAENTGYAPLYKLAGKNLFDILKIDSLEEKQVKDQFARGKTIPVFEAVLCLVKNRIKQIDVEIRAIPHLDEHEKLIGFRGTMTDISVRKAAEAKALYMSMHDELTGLPNRRVLFNNLEESIRRASQYTQSVVVAAVDLDGFKAVNDAYGHAVGDELLKQVATRFARTLRPVDLAYRTGGDEFVIIFDGLEQDSAVHVSHAVSTRLIEKIGEPYSVQNLNVNIGASIGLASYPKDDHSAHDLLRMADLAMYAAKEAGKNCAIRFNHSHDTDAKMQRRLEQDLRKAIEYDEFYLMYQPQVDTVTEQTVGFEALIRWAHPELGEIQPGDFIPVAEKLNIMDSIGNHVLDKACQFASTWSPYFAETIPRLAVNVSPRQFANRDFFTGVVQTLERHKLDPSSLELEITEEVLVDNFNRVSAVLGKLRDIGVHIAVDDFGSGQTSLRYLNQFPLDTIKIDQSFISNIGINEKATEITHTIVVLGRKLGINVIAEGVEENSQLELLRQWKCDQIQGFLFSRPMTQNAVTRWMEIQDEHQLRKSA